MTDTDLDSCYMSAIDAPAAFKAATNWPRHRPPLAGA